MNEKKHFNPDDDISPEDIQRYFEHKGIPDVICPLCRKDAFILTDSMPFVSESMVGVDVKYRLALKPKLVKPSSYYRTKQKTLDEDTKKDKIPLDVILDNHQPFEFFNWGNSKEFIILTCEHCGNTILLDRLPILNFLATEEKNNGK